MKFFTKEWANGMLSDEAWAAVTSQYRSHLQNLLPRLPEPISELATGISIHDGLIQRVIVAPKNGTLEILLRCGDLQLGYFDFFLLYSSASLGALDLQALGSAALDPHESIIYDEIDIESQTIYVHRILFASTREATVRFTKLESKRVSVSNRTFERIPEPYIEIF